MGELLEFRDLAVRFAARDITLRYRQTMLGVVWVFLQPLLAAGAFTVVFGRVARLSSGSGVPYLVFAYSGLLLWNAFSGTVTKATNSVVSNAGLVAKTFFPRILLPFSTLFGSLLDFAVAGVLLTGLMVRYEIAVGPRALLLPVWVLLSLSLALGTALATSSLAVAYRDVQLVVPFCLQLLLFLSPVAYPLRAVPSDLRLAYSANPLSALLTGFRWSLLGQAPPDPLAVLYATFVSITVLVSGFLIFQRWERGFADVI